MTETTTLKLLKMKQAQEKIVMVTAYDYTSAKLVAAAEVDLILVGDSLGMVMLGYSDTLAVTMEEMLHHTKAVARATKKAMVIGDLPFMSYQVSTEQAITNAGRLLQEGGAQAVKLEGGASVAPAIARITAAGIPVFGHLGFTPQSINQLGGAIFQGKTATTAQKLLEEALQLEDAGICGLVLELIPLEVAALITSRLRIPTIGIGSGLDCDGQVLVWHDFLGMDQEFHPRHAKIFAEVGSLIRQGIVAYATAVKDGSFPTIANTKILAIEEKAALEEAIGRENI